MRYCVSSSFSLVPNQSRENGSRKRTRTGRRASEQDRGSRRNDQPGRPRGAAARAEADGEGRTKRKAGRRGDEGGGPNHKKTQTEQTTRENKTQARHETAQTDDRPGRDRREGEQRGKTTEERRGQAGAGKLWPKVESERCVPREVQCEGRPTTTSNVTHRSCVWERKHEATTKAGRVHLRLILRLVTPDPGGRAKRGRNGGEGQTDKTKTRQDNTRQDKNQTRRDKGQTNKTGRKRDPRH